MPDVVDKETRRRMMSGIRGKNTKPEIAIRSALHRRGFRFRVHVKKLPGTPDIVLPKYRAVIQIHGCFWHGHDCHLFKWPSTRQEWWRAKIERTRSLDARTVTALREDGWRVAQIRECALKGRTRLGRHEVVDTLEAWITDPSRDELVIQGEE